MELELIAILVLAALNVAALVLLLLQGQKIDRLRKRQDKAASEALLPLVQLQKGQADSIDRHLEQSAQQSAMLLRQSEETRRETQALLERLNRDNAQQLEQMRVLVDRRLTGALQERLDASFSQVSGQLEKVYRGLGEMQQLAQGVGDLKRILSNVKTRGVWGETQLGALLEEAFAPGQYIRNAAIKENSLERVEFAIRLPSSGEGDDTLLPIDSKFPQESYLTLLAAQEQGDAALTEKARQALGTAVRVQAKKIADKYILPPRTTDFALLFLPTESLYAEVLRVDGLCEGLSRDYRVVPAGPTTLLALLNALQTSFRATELRRHSEQVLQTLTLVKRDFVGFTEALARAKQRVRQLGDTLDDTQKRSDQLLSKLDDLEKNDAEPLP